MCCVDDSAGQRKIDFTILSRFAQVEADNTLSCPIDLFRKYQQVIFRKRTDDLLSNPKADRFLTQLPATEFILFGIGVEGSVKALALALLAREKRVTIVVDACGYWSKATADLAMRQIKAKGGRTITVNELLKRKLDRRRRYPLERRSRFAQQTGCRHNRNSPRTAATRNNPLRERSAQ
ncbi:MAG: isochorismatase family protein [Phycisphaerae bacterium]